MGYLEGARSGASKRKRQRQSPPYSDETLAQIDELNFKNWIHYYSQIVQALDRRPRTRFALEEYGQIKRIMGLTKVLRKGIEFGVLRTGSGQYHLTTKAMEYYEGLVVGSCH